MISSSFVLRSVLRSNPAYSLKSGRLFSSISSSDKINTENLQNVPSSTDEVVNFRDGKIAYASSNMFELLRSSLVYKLCSYSFIVSNNKKLMEVSRKVLGKYLFKKLMQMTFYGQFVAGETQEDVLALVNHNRQYGVKSILDYSVEKDISESETVERHKESLSQALHVPNESTKGTLKQFRPNVEFADRRKEVYSARTYFYESEKQCDANMEVFLRCIDASAKGYVDEGFTAIKLTALGRPHFLLQFSDFLVQMERLFYLLTVKEEAGEKLPPSLASIDRDDFQQRLQSLGVEISYDKFTHYFTLLDRSKNGSVDLLEWLHFKHFEHDLASIFQVRDKETGKVENLVSTLTPQGICEMRNMLNRLDTLAQHAKSKGVRIMVDAEHSYFQPAIRRIAMEMMRRFNKESLVIFNTYQCYLKNALTTLYQDLRLGELGNFYVGVKLVRGAYFEQERKRAKKLGYPDPINANYESTTAMYETCLEEVFSAIKHRPSGRVAAMVATHNEGTIRFTLQRMKDLGIKRDQRVICFGQLLGMCDHISFPLGHEGYSVYKYVPYGPVEEVLPYLSRRAYENQSVLSDTSTEREMRWAEVKRRVFSGEVFSRR